MHIYKYEVIYSFMIAEMWKSILRNTYTQNSKKTQPAISWNLLYFENALFIIAKEGWQIKYSQSNNRQMKKEGRVWPFSGLTVFT